MAKQVNTNDLYNNSTETIMIEGVTNSGQAFRPSNWAHRISYGMAVYKQHRIRYSPLLTPYEHKNGYQCILIDHRLKDTNVTMYNSIMQFAKYHNLRICQGYPNNESTINQLITK